MLFKVDTYTTKGVTLQDWFPKTTQRKKTRSVAKEIAITPRREI